MGSHGSPPKLDETSKPVENGDVACLKEALLPFSTHWKWQCGLFEKGAAAIFKSVWVLLNCVKNCEFALFKRWLQEESHYHDYYEKELFLGYAIQAMLLEAEGSMA